MRREKREKLSKSAASGTVALVFLILGFQIAVFVMKVVERPRAEPLSAEAAALEMEVEAGNGAGRASASSGAALAAASDGEGGRNAAASPGGGRVRAAASPARRTRLGGYAAPTAPARPARTYESFPFDPNTVSLDSLQRLGLSLRQAETICNYRSKGGKFRRKSDFKKMYVVSDTLFERLEPFIEIARLELNSADSAALTALRGIGPYYARRIVEYRASLGGFVSVGQLLEIKGFDPERLAGLSDDVQVDSSAIMKIDIWRTPPDSLARHPYIRRRGADAIVRFKAVYDSAQWTIEHLASENVLPPNDISRLRPYL